MSDLTMEDSAVKVAPVLKLTPLQWQRYLNLNGGGVPCYCPCSMALRMAIHTLYAQEGALTPKETSLFCAMLFIFRANHQGQSMEALDWLERQVRDLLRRELHVDIMVEWGEEIFGGEDDSENEFRAVHTWLVDIFPES